MPLCHPGMDHLGMVLSTPESEKEDQFIQQMEEKRQSLEDAIYELVEQVEIYPNDTDLVLRKTADHEPKF